MIESFENEVTGRKATQSEVNRFKMVKADRE